MQLHCRQSPNRLGTVLQHRSQQHLPVGQHRRRPSLHGDGRIRTRHGQRPHHHLYRHRLGLLLQHRCLLIRRLLRHAYRGSGRRLHHPNLRPIERRRHLYQRFPHCGHRRQHHGRHHPFQLHHGWQGARRDLHRHLGSRAELSSPITQRLERFARPERLAGHRQRLQENRGVQRQQPHPRPHFGHPRR